MPTSTDAKADKPPHSDLKGLRVLVVEDEWHVANDLKSIFEGEGMEVSGPVATLADARQLASAQNVDFAVVDINLRGETAYGLIDQLLDRGVGVVVASGYGVLPGLTEKVLAVLRKPFNAPDLLATFHRCP